MTTITLDPPAAVIAPTAEEARELDFGAVYTVAGYGGVAFHLLGYVTEWTEESWTLACDDRSHRYDVDHDDYCYLYSEPERTERDDLVRAVMVGDDRVHVVDVDDLTEISDEDYCPGCGQTGCGAYR